VVPVPIGGVPAGERRDDDRKGGSRDTGQGEYQQRPPANMRHPLSMSYRARGRAGPNVRP
jgi:hypothetical protein